jgi:hypothetical protein
VTDGGISTSKGTVYQSLQLIGLQSEGASLLAQKENENDHP